LVAVDVAGWDEPGDAVLDGDGPVVVVDAVVVEGAEEDAVVEVGGSALGPPGDVVGFGEGGWVGAAGPGAAAVAFGEGEFLSAGEEAGAGAEVEDLGWAVQHHRDEVGVGGEAAEGASSDGFVDAVDGGGAETGFEGVVVGADDDGDGGELGGGAAAAVIYALKARGIAVELVSRKLHPGSTMTYQDIDEKVIRDHLLIVNTTPLGMYPETEFYPPIPYHLLSKDHLLYDLVYNPGMTRFLELGAAQGAVTKNGGDMLYLQAEENWKIWNL
jgi:hypothetical protein